MDNIFIIKKRPYPDMFVYWGLSLMLLLGWGVEILQPGVITNFFDVILLFAALSLYFKKSIYKRVFLKYLFLLFSYFFISLIYAVFLKNVNILDFLIAYKFVIYLLLLLPFSNINMLDNNSISRLLKLMLYMFAIVYFIKFSLGDKRPIFFIENNFEIMLLCFMFYANHIAHNFTKMMDMFLLLFITVISGSRSGIMLALLTIIFCIDIKYLIKTKNIFIPCMAVLGFFGVIYVFQSRSEGGVESIDRYKFFQNFLESISDWGWFQYVFGMERISKLPDHVCSQLAYYESLLSFEQNGSCYSVILHSFNMRILYDHGILVIFLLFLILNYILKNRTIKEKTLVYLLLIINGFSVSSINSVYAILGLVIISSIPLRHNLLR